MNESGKKGYTTEQEKYGITTKGGANQELQKDLLLNKEDIQEKVLKIFSNQVPQLDVELDSVIYDLALDSLDVVEITSHCNKEFNLDLDCEDFFNYEYYYKYTIKKFTNNIIKLINDTKTY